MKNAVVLVSMALALTIAFGNDRRQEADFQRVLVMPFTVDPSIEDHWEGLAPILALQSLTTDQERLIPFTACRRKLNEYSMSVVSPASLATRVKLAGDLNADLLISGHLEKNQLVLQLYRTHSHQLERLVLKEKSEGGYLEEIAGIIKLPLEPPTARQYDLYRVWASIYYIEEPENARPIVDKLLEHELTGWLFVQEYLDIFGDPSRNSSHAADVAWWRDFFLKKEHYARAMNLSKKTMALRHNPRDLIAHARVLMAGEDFQEACIYLKKAESFGFMERDLRAQLTECHKPRQQEPTRTDIR